jgi:hypothetical protein
MKSIAESQHTPILEGLNTLAEEQAWVVEVQVLPLVSGHRSVREKQCRETINYTARAVCPPLREPSRAEWRTTDLF